MAICKILECQRNVYHKKTGVCRIHYERFRSLGTYDRPSPDQRFWKYVKKSSNENDCWLWIGAKSRGYGYFKCKSHNAVGAHRVSYEISTGVPPGEFHVCHKCDNPICVNPSHLFLGTRSDNQKDSVFKKRHANSKKTHCKRGHLLDADNLVLSSLPIRECRTCSNQKQKEKREKINLLSTVQNNATSL